MFGHSRPIGFGLKRPERTASRLPRRRQPFAGFEALTRRQSGLGTGIASVTFHAVVIALLVLSTRADRSPSQDATQKRSAPVTVTMMYVPPKEVPTRAKPQHHHQPSPAPVEAAPPPAPDSPLPPNPASADAPEHDQPAAMSPTPKSSAVAGDPEAAPRSSRESPNDRLINESEDPMVMEARRLFGPKAASSDGALAGPLQAGLPVGLLGGGRRCAWGGLDAAAEDGPHNGVVEGIVRNETSGHPLPGAFLQLLGTGSATFSDERGHYRLTFDPSLVDRCRSQIVRVSAPGYHARNMVLAYGSWSDNTVDMMVR